MAEGPRRVFDYRGAGLRKSPLVPGPYLGGLAVTVGAVFAQVAVSGVPFRAAIILLAAVLLGLFGAVDDRRNLHPLRRLAAQLAAAAVAVALGVQGNVTGSPVGGAVATVVWIVAVTNAVNFLDNMDGLASGLVVASAGSAFALSLVAGQTVVATAAGAMVGACVGFLVYNRRLAIIYTGDAGSLFLGFLLAIVVSQVDPALPPLHRVVVPLLLVAIPVLDIATVMIARWRNGRALYRGGRDHLSHRLVARGWSPTEALLTLVGFQALLGGIAVLVGSGVLPLWTVVILPVPILLLLLWLAMKADIYGRRLVDA